MALFYSILETWNGRNRMDVDIIIPVYRPTEKFLRLLDLLERQTQPVHRIIIVNTEKEYFDQLVKETDLREKYKNLEVRHISKAEFDHGKTRNYGVSLSETPYFVMMTDDAIPADKRLVERLLAPFQKNEKVGMSYARQVPGEGCGLLESYTRSFNYPQTSCMKSAENMRDMGLKAFFASNVCAAYRRDIFDELKGFTDHTIFNEDMIYARGLLDAGYLIAYEARAAVIHSHNYSALGQFKRNFDLGVSHALYPQVFEGLPAESEGIRLVKKSSIYVLRKGKPWLIAKLFWQSGFKYLGYFLGRRYRLWPKSVVKAFTMNKEFW